MAFGLGVAAVHRRKKHLLVHIAHLQLQWAWCNNLLSTQKDDAKARQLPFDSYEIDPYLIGNDKLGYKLSDPWLLARVLIASREDQDLVFLQYLVARGSKENPQSEQLRILKLAIMRFVWKDMNEYDNFERNLRMDARSLPIDYQYILYAIARKTTQERAKGELGQGHVSAINLMEYDMNFQRAQTAHLACLQSMKKFRKTVFKSRTGKGEQFARYLLRAAATLRTFDNHLCTAEQVYSSLSDKYSQSLSLLLLCADFHDYVLNDEEEADKKRGIADDVQDRDVESRAGSSRRGASTNDTSGTSARVAAKQRFDSWVPYVMKREQRNLNILKIAVSFLVLLLMVGSTATYATIDMWLFPSLETQLLSIKDLGYLRTLCVSGAYLLRDRWMSLHVNDLSTALVQQQRLSNISNGIRGLHLGDYERDLAAHRGDTREARYLSRKVNVAVPGQGGWRDESLSYWAMGIEFALRLEEASRVSITHTTSGLNCSTEMRGMAYVFENVLRSAIPAFEETVSLAEQRAAKVQYFVTAVNYGALAGLGTIMLVLSVVVVRGNVRAIRKVHHTLFACRVAFALPHATVQKLLNHYTKLENAFLENMRTEDEERLELVDQQVGDEHPDIPDICVEPLDSPRHPGASTAGLVPAVRDPTNEDKTIRGMIESGQVHEPESSPQHRDQQSVAELTHRNLSAHLSLHREGSGLRSEPSRAMHDACRIVGAGFGAHPANEVHENHIVSVEYVTSGTPVESPLERGEQGVSGEQGASLSAGGADTLVPDVHAVASLPDHTYMSEAPTPKKICAEALELQGVDVFQAGASQASGMPKKTCSIMRVSSRELSGSEASASMFSSRAAGLSKRDSFFRGSQQLCLHESDDDEKSDGKHEPHHSVAWKESQDEDGTAEAQDSKDARLEDGACDEGMRTGEKVLDEQCQAAVLRLAAQDQPYQTRMASAGVMLVIVGVLCCATFLRPASRITELITMAPILNQAARRRSLLLTCIFLSRELAFEDSMTRMSKAEVASALRYNLNEFIRSDTALRLGNDLGIQVGGDSFGNKHNQAMYYPGCPWRSNATSDSILTSGSDSRTWSDLDSLACDTPSRPGGILCRVFDMVTFCWHCVSLCMQQQATAHISIF